MADVKTRGARVHPRQLRRWAATSASPTTTRSWSSHILDSTGFLELITFLEETFGIAVDDEEMVPENLDSLDNIDGYVARKRAAVQAARRGRAGCTHEPAAAEPRRPRTSTATRRSTRIARAHASRSSAASCTGAAWSSRCPAASTARSARRWPCARSGASKVLRPAAARARLLAPTAPTRATLVAEQLGIAYDGRGHRARPSRRSAATAGATRRSARCSPSTATGWKSKIVIAGGRDGGAQLLQAGRAVAGRRDAGGAAADPRVPADRRRHQLQAAHPQDAGVLPRRPAELRRASARRTGSSTTRASS